MEKKWILTEPDEIELFKIACKIGLDKLKDYAEIDTTLPMVISKKYCGSHMGEPFEFDNIISLQGLENSILEENQKLISYMQKLYKELDKYETMNFKDRLKYLFTGYRKPKKPTFIDALKELSTIVHKRGCCE